MLLNNFERIVRVNPGGISPVNGGENPHRASDIQIISIRGSFQTSFLQEEAFAQEEMRWLMIASLPKLKGLAIKIGWYLLLPYCGKGDDYAIIRELL